MGVLRTIAIERSPCDGTSSYPGGARGHSPHAPGGEDAGRHFVYDAWNRLRKVYADDGDGQFEPSDGQGTGEDALIAAYQYDGAKRRIEKAVTEGADTHYYYNHDWQVVEQRESPLPLGEGQGEGGTALPVSYQYLWSPRYIDSPVLRDRYDAEGELDASARVYYLGDANHNVTALVGLVETAPSVFAWQVAERYLYDPYGRATVCDADWTIRPDGPDANTTPGDESAFGNAVLYCGYYLDAETGLYHVRHRMYHATLSTWTSRDPLGYEGRDRDLYLYSLNQPLTRTDASGLAAQEKRPSEASPRARELETLLPYKLDTLKQIAKATTQVERFGVILKAKDSNGKPQYKFCECISKTSWQKVKNEFGEEEPFGATKSPFQWWGSEQMHGALVPKPGADGKIDLDATSGTLDRGYPIEFNWHTHPADGDPWPSTGDGTMCKDNDIVGVMIRYIGRMRGGKVEDDWAIWIIDTDGKTYEYKPPATPAK